MAQKIVTTYIDDLTGEASEEIRTHTILVDGAGVEIDLSPDSHDKLLEALKPFFGARGARRVRGGLPTKATSRVKRSAGPGASNQNTAEIRKWARENGHNVNDRGRVPAEIREAYEKANK
ncbi:Lsr2 family protein [Streptomyces griseus]|uniref:Lsr2 family protein n=1 Tax=Streptomyces griseus TaxID=1911 RepID=UPI0037A7B399